MGGDLCVVDLAHYHSKAMMSALKTCIAICVCLFLGSALQGCGCDNDKFKKCITEKSSSLTCETYSQCVKDASCCDAEVEGSSAKGKDVAAAWCAIHQMGKAAGAAGKTSATSYIPDLSGSCWHICSHQPNMAAAD